MAINFNYNKTIQQADELDRICKTFLNLANKRMAVSMEQMKGAWSGEAATIFAAYSLKIQEELQNKANYLAKTADALREVAKTMKAAEEKAKQLAAASL